MDQIRKALAWLKQYHFWVLSVLVALIGLGCWYSAAGTLSKEFRTNQFAITTEFKNQDDLRSKPFHPNEDINRAQMQQIELQAKNVETIWKDVYERQSKNVLKWPPDLSQNFRDYVSKRKFGDNITRDLCDNYRDYIDRHFETLPKRVGARVMAENESGGMGGEGYTRGGGGRGMFRGGEGGPPIGMGDDGRMGLGAADVQDDDYLCEWLDQGLVRQELNFRTTPSPIKIWVTQENLWVYHTLLDIIANTNEAAHADRMANAAVRRIISLEVGRPAALASQSRGRVELIQAPSSGAETMTGEGGMPVGGMEGGERGAPMGGEMMSSPYGGEGRGLGFDESGMGGGALSPEQEEAVLTAGRYVDAEGKPLGGLSAAPAAEGSDPSLAAPAPVADTSGPFERLPVRMILQMDQRWLTHLIAECASQPLQVEVKEVRINPSDVSGMGGMSGGGEGYRGGMMGASGGGSSTFQPRTMNTGEMLAFKQQPNLVTVVIQGIVTIFNEPDPAVLQAGEQVASTP